MPESKYSISGQAVANAAAYFSHVTEKELQKEKILKLFNDLSFIGQGWLHIVYTGFKLCVKFNHVNDLLNLLSTIPHNTSYKTTYLKLKKRLIECEFWSKLQKYCKKKQVTQT